MKSAIKYGLHPRTGNLIQVIKCVCSHPRIYQCMVIAGDRIYHTNYSCKKIETKFERLNARQFKKLAYERIQMSLFEDEPVVHSVGDVSCNLQ